MSIRKVVVIGNGRVGKTSLIHRFYKNKFDSNEKQTNNAACFEKKVEVSDNKSVTLSIWDTAGQEEYKSIAPMYYQDSECAIIVYDITIEQTFDKVKNWVLELQNAVDVSKVLICIVGNKSDLQHERQISNETAQTYAKSIGAVHFLTSAKNSNGITELFDYIANQLDQKVEKKRNSKMRISKDKTTHKSEIKQSNSTCC